MSKRRDWLRGAGVLTAVGALAAFVWGCQPVWSHDFWISRGGYKGLHGVSCCGSGDCKMIPEADVKITAGGYQLSTGEVVPFSEAQQSEDQDYWRCKRYDGVRRCFFAPVHGS